jgi:putative phosphoribosyl transferase
MRDVADEVVCATTPEPFYAVGLWYQSFEQTTDEEVRALLADAERRLTVPQRATGSSHDDAIDERAVTIHDGRAALTGALSIPRGARGVVVFAHGSGSSRHSPRNQRVARELRRAGLVTLIMDLLSTEEERQDAGSRAFRFDIGLLARRLIGAIEWLGELPETRGQPIGLFGASTGAAAALVAAAARSSDVQAVVSRGGRPDLAGNALALVRAPTLLIVGGDDEMVIELNQQAMREMRAPVKLEIVPGATHLFEEPGALQQAAQLARDWFLRYLASTPLDTRAFSERDRDSETRW